MPAYPVRVVTGPAPRSDDPEAVEAVVAAARRCYARYGVHRTRMEDIAAEAGMVRQTLYTLVSGREQLIELAMIDWCREFAAGLFSLPAAVALDPAEELVEILAVAIETTRADPEFGYLAEALSRTRTTELLAGATPVHTIVVQTMHPLLERARSVLRDDITEDEIASWLATVLAVMTARNDLQGREFRDFLRKFAVRALLR
jgi:AcrR family transcriptional regulator